jgi:multiple sugar transport system permease protein
MSTKVKRSRLSWSKVAQQLEAYVFLLPAILLFATFAWYPSVLGFIIAFQKLDFINPPQWVGFDNFRLLLRDPNFARVWLNTLQYTGLSLLLSTL